MAKILFLLIVTTSFYSHAENSHNIKLGALWLAVGGNLDYEYRISDKLSLGPSFYAWGGCSPGASASNIDRSCEARYAYGLKSNYYLNGTFESGFYTAFGIYSLRLISHKEQNNVEYSGYSSFFHADLIFGYFWGFQSGFNISVGAGIGYTPNYKPIPVSSSVNGPVQSEDLSSSTPIAGELNLGWSF